MTYDFYDRIAREAVTEIREYDSGSSPQQAAAWQAQSYSLLAIAAAINRLAEVIEQRS